MALAPNLPLLSDPSSSIMIRSMAPPCSVMLDSPRTIVPSVSLADRLSWPTVAGRMRPWTAKTRLDS